MQLTNKNIIFRIFPIVGTSQFFFLNFPFLFYINLFIYLFIFGCVGSLLLHTGFLQLRRGGATLCCSVQASHCGGFSCCGARALGTGFSSCGTWASVVVACGLQSAGSVVVVHRVNCSAACGIFLDQGLNPCPLTSQLLKVILRCDFFRILNKHAYLYLIFYS